MNDAEMDRLLGLAQPAPLEGPVLAEAGQKLLEEIMSDNITTDRPEREIPSLSVLPGPRRYRKGLRLLGMVAVVVAFGAAILTPILLFGGGADKTVPTAPVSTSPTPSISEMAEPTVVSANPFVFPSAPGWKVELVDERDWGQGVHGEIQFHQGTASLQVNWQPDGYQEQVTSRTEEYGEPKGLDFAGGPAVVFDKAGQEFELLAQRENGFVEVSVDGAQNWREARQWLGQLTALSPQKWYSALPSDVVTPGEIIEVMTGILNDIPYPPGFQDGVFVNGLTNDYESFGVGLTSVVTCAWLDEYEQARKTGDEPTMAEVDTVLRGAGNWTFIKKTERDLGWGQVIAEYAAPVSERKPVQDYRSGLGCDSYDLS